LLQQAKSVFPSSTSPDQPSSSHPGIFTLSSFSSAVLSHSWIIDTGASDHITCSLDHFSSYESINPLPVTLPTGNSVHATHIGTVSLSSKIVLHRVLYIPQFAFNLLSVSRLTSDLPVSFIFSGSQCLIHDQSSQMRIGLALSHKV
ncbi:Retrovirus-related Pol polyprotein from transposon RE1, partial [Linum perenne]